MSKRGLAAGALAAAVLVAALFVWGDSLQTFFRPLGEDSREAGGRVSIAFGRALAPDGRSVTDPATTFKLGEDIAWVVTFEGGVQANELIVELFELTGEGQEIFLDRNKMAVKPTDEGVYNFSNSNAFWSLSPAGLSGNSHTYRVKYLRGGVVAQGDFSIMADVPGIPAPAN